MFELSHAPLTTAEFWQLVGVGIGTLMLAAICMVGLWCLFRKDEPDNYQSHNVRRNLFKTPR